jgi:predicted MPP superfamily phosphohydrolase
MTRSRYIIIGDVHGCLTELQALICRIAPRPDDTLVFLGDLVDKGPESPGVVRWVRHLSTRYRLVLIEGNHEEKHRRWRHHMGLGSPVAHTMTGTQQIAAITQAMSAADIAFLETGRLYFRIPYYDALVVHAGVPPALATLPDDPQEIGTYTRNNATSMGKCSASDLSRRKEKSCSLATKQSAIAIGQNCTMVAWVRSTLGIRSFFNLPPLPFRMRLDWI